MVTKIEISWIQLGTTWTTFGHHLGQLGKHLAPPKNFVGQDNTWAHLDTWESQHRRDQGDSTWMSQDFLPQDGACLACSQEDFDATLGLLMTERTSAF